jgi:hypothetical protein
MLLLSTAYFAPIQYYSILVRNEHVVIEKHENYNKQSWRNRCAIYSSNGLLYLVVPVVKTDKPKIPITEVEISYDMPWQKQHFKAIESAYRRSPFYDYYIDDLMTFFNCRHRLLYEFNMQILNTVCLLMQIPFRVQESLQYVKTGDEGSIDLRNGIHPKANRHLDDAFSHYTQVFAEKRGFKPNLSILDLLFHTGPEAKKYCSGLNLSLP